jgi:hypothetical protein
MRRTKSVLAHPIHLHALCMWLGQGNAILMHVEIDAAIASRAIQSLATLRKSSCLVNCTLLESSKSW